MLHHPLLRGVLVICGIGVAVILGNARYFEFSAPPSSTLSVRTNHTTRKHYTSTKVVSAKCRTGSRLVNGTEFSQMWPNHVSPKEVWRHPDVNDSMVLWHPSKFYQLCVAQGDALGPSFWAPPRYQSQDRPMGLHMVMMGDSLMRYQFIMLIHYLHTGHWVHDTMQPNLLRETSLGGDGGWQAFYRALEAYFGRDNMISEGYRGKENWYINMFENDFYMDRECLDNSVTFFAKFSWGLRGYHTPAEVNHWFHSTDDKSNINITFPESVYEEGHYNFSYYDYEPFLRNVVAKLEPRPRVFVFNQGLWHGAEENLSNLTVLRQIQDTIHELGMVSIYKTTTKYSSDTTPGLVDYEALCCQVFDHCLRMDWTACAPPTAYWDNCHFLAHTNLRTNEQLFDILQQEGMMPF